MDFSWLGDLFGKIIGLFNPLKSIAHWKIWVELQNWYKRFKQWRDWYRDHIMNPMKQLQQLQRQLYNQFFAPLLRLVDHIRQLTQIVGIFNRKLANQLNLYFLRVESYILQPFNIMTSRTNALGRAFQGMMTPLGYFDRGTLLNSVWRDAALIKEILHNPFEQHPPAATPAPRPTVSEQVSAVRQYLASGTGPYAEDVNTAIQHFRDTLAAG